MLKSYLLVFDVEGGPRKEILDYLDTRSEVKNWYAFMATAIFVISESTAFQLAEIFRQRFPGREFVITEVARGSNDGWLDKNIWEFVNNPRSSGRWP